jgi:hypothetical protein
MERFLTVFKRQKAVVIGMIHVDALPGTPKSQHPLTVIVDHARKEAQLYLKAGIVCSCSSSK